MSKKLNTGLGRGLSSLLGGEAASSSNNQRVPSAQSSLAAVSEIEIAAIVPNPLQPRSDFDGQRLDELAQSIKILGVIQPITVVPLSVGKYQIISGERRFRASRLAGLKTIPAYIKKDVEDTDGAKLELALVENVQRADLNPVEVALSLKRLTEECNLTQEALSERVGINRATIANYIRLLRLPPEVQLALKKEAITMGHAKALLALDNEEKMITLTNKIIEEQMSVRQTEQLVRQALGGNKARVSKHRVPSDFEKEASDLLSRYFSSKIKVRQSGRGGSIVIKYKSEDELQIFISHLKQLKS